MGRLKHTAMVLTNLPLNQPGIFSRCGKMLQFILSAVFNRFRDGYFFVGIISNKRQNGNALEGGKRLALAEAIFSSKIIFLLVKDHKLESV